MIAYSKPWITSADINIVESVLRSNMIARGEGVSNYSASLSKFLGMKGGVVLSSGSSAFVLALKVLGVGERSEVILPTYVYHVVYYAVIYLGTTPALCDFGLDWTMTAETIEPYISPRTDAIIVAHIFGVVADAISIGHFSIPIIEDCYQVFGANLGGYLAGSIGDIGIYSFDAIKCMSTGEGGFAGTTSQVLFNKMTALRDSSVLFCLMTDLQAALGSSQLKRYTKFVEKRKQLGLRYFVELPKKLKLHLQSIKDRIIFFRFPLNGNLDFEAAQEKFSRFGVVVRRGVDNFLHRRINLPDNLFPNAVKHCNHTLSIPFYPALKDNEQSRVIRTVSSTWRKNESPY